MRPSDLLHVDTSLPVPDEMKVMSLEEFAGFLGIKPRSALRRLEASGVPTRLDDAGELVIPFDAVLRLPFSVREFAIVTGVHPHTVWRWCTTGELNCWRRKSWAELHPDEVRRTTEVKPGPWEIEAGEAWRVTHAQDDFFVRERAKILESALRVRAQHLIDEVNLDGPAKKSPSRRRTKITKRRKPS